jgi:hypothetical protein
VSSGSFFLWLEEGWRGLFGLYRDAGGRGDCRSGVFIAEEYDGTENKGSGHTTTINIETLLVAFMEDFQTWGLIFSAAKV